ncbi:MAG: S1/P1 nuclease [Rhodopila sp.]
MALKFLLHFVGDIHQPLHAHRPSGCPALRPGLHLLFRYAPVQIGGNAPDIGTKPPDELSVPVAVKIPCPEAGR